VVLKEKRLQRSRSLLLAAALGATAYLAIEVFGPDRRLFEDEETEDPGPPTFRSPRPAGLKIPLGVLHRAP
jgi:hypothetical protein